MSLSLLSQYLLLSMFLMLLHPPPLIVDLFHVLYCSGLMCVGVTVWFGWGGVVSLCRLKHCFRYQIPILEIEESMFPHKLQRNIILKSVRQHNHFITQGNYKATCFDYRLVILRPILSIVSQLTVVFISP